MSGGQLDLVSKGVEDIIIINPTITFFKSVHMRHYPFSIQPLIQKFKSNVNFNKRSSCTLSFSGDLINKVTLVIELPALQFDFPFAWVKRIGFEIINNIEIEIGGQLIDRQYGSWLNIWYSLTKENYQRYDWIIGDTSILTNFSNSKPSFKLFIPLQFWFNRFIGLSLPILCLQKTEVNINLTLNKFQDCVYFFNNTIVTDVCNLVEGDFIYQKNNKVGIFSSYNIITNVMTFCKLKEINSKKPFYDKNGNSYKFYENHCTKCPNIDIQIVDSFLIVDYIILDCGLEKELFSNIPRNEYLIEQVLYQEKIIYPGDTVQLDFKNMCKQLIWEYDDVNSDITQILSFNDNVDINIDDYKYYNSVQPYRYCSNSPNNKINIYSFSDNFNRVNIEHSGYVNLSEIELGFTIKSLTQTPYYVKFYAVCYNLLRIDHDVCGLVFI